MSRTECSKRKESKPFDSLSTLSEMVIYLFGRRLSLLFNVVFTAINRLSDFGVRTLFPFGNAIPLPCVFACKVINNNRNSQVFYFFLTKQMTYAEDHV